MGLSAPASPQPNRSAFAPSAATMNVILRTCLACLSLYALPLTAVGEPARPATPAAPAEARPSRISTRAESVLPHLRERRPDLAWAATGTWADSRGRPLAPAQRRREAVRAASRLRDTRHFREAAAFAAEIDSHLAAAERALSPQALPQGGASNIELAAILDLRAALAVGFEMNTARARELRRRSAELAPERLPRRPDRRQPAPPETSAVDTESSPEGGRP